MATLAGCLCLCLTLWMVGSRPSASIESRSILSGSWWGAQASGGIKKAGRQHWDARNFSAAERLYQTGYQEALRHHDIPAIIRYLSSIAGCRFAQFRYRDALESYLQARRLANRSRTAKNSEQSPLISPASTWKFGILTRRCGRRKKDVPRWRVCRTPTIKRTCSCSLAV